MSYRCFRSGSGGYTLIELLTVLVLMGVLSALALPTYAETVRRARVRAALAHVTTDLYRARAMAARSGREISIRFEMAHAGCTARYVLEDPELNLRLREVDVEKEAPGVCLSISGSPLLRVNSRGMPVGASRKVRARAGRLTDSLSISLVGRVFRWSDPS